MIGIYFSTQSISDNISWKIYYVNLPNQPANLPKELYSLWPPVSGFPPIYTNFGDFSTNKEPEVDNSNKDYAVRLEIRPTNLVPLYSGMTMTMIVRIFLPETFYNYRTYPPTRLFDVSCTIFDSLVHCFN